MISDQIALYSVQLPLCFLHNKCFLEKVVIYISFVCCCCCCLFFFSFPNFCSLFFLQILNRLSLLARESHSLLKRQIETCALQTTDFKVGNAWYPMVPVNFCWDETELRGLIFRTAASSKAYASAWESALFASRVTKTLEHKIIITEPLMLLYYSHIVVLIF